MKSSAGRIKTADSFSEGGTAFDVIHLAASDTNPPRTPRFDPRAAARHININAISG
jgi:hypothetical protein